MSASREAVLQRVRSALDGAASTAEPAPRGYRRTGSLGHEGRVELFCRRVGEYRAEVDRIDEGAVAAAVSSACDGRGACRVVVPDGLPADWLPEGIERVADRGLSPRELDAVDGVVTGCTAAIAETGTLVLAGAPAEGRRAITLVPDLHVCVVRERQIVELVPEALALLAERGLVRAPLTFVSGPSATSDIELSRVEGVHGPRTLVVLVVKESP
jgi:L-lactate dehydrogenase complex protein LldG